MELLTIKDLSKEDKNLNIITNMNLSINKNETVGIKCSEEACLTLLNLITGKIYPSKGTIKQSNETKINIVLKDDGLYERLTVNEYLNFFKDIFNNSKLSISEIQYKLGLTSLKNTKIKKLSYSEKGRLRIGRALLSNANLILIQEPTLYHDMESSLIIKEILSYINTLGISLLCISVSLEEILALDCTSYILDSTGFTLIEPAASYNNNETEKTTISTTPILKIAKIPAKVNGKIILFNPTEITYIESLNGTTYINVEDKKFPCTMSLTELENKLKELGFFRCHRSYLVNLQRVREVINWTRNSFSLTLDDNNKNSIPLSKSKLEDIKNLLYV
ncbi:LytTR family transcriptional regulator DNA-binding domain-containing protein [Clostridium pasteurianum]|uniref:LytTR family transcriptional regulator DNA-binding domain-containing protein n=1 Tax=Clostridium pasteurianum TaxID=1501 RepID=UPI002260C9C2|nr:LytTR family transcriptional regulator DNA-binding domain-containing protein [Clostridium pasteurianum]UZW14456.1 LytTR family transcriptional regulator DNA-binding domain-containing protein [Clostridium pasteurianum]